MSVVTRKVLASRKRTVSARAHACRVLDPWKNPVDLNEDLLWRGSEKKKRKERKPPRREERKKDAPRVRGYSSYLIESGRARRSAGGDTESRVTIDRRKELVDKVNGSPRWDAAAFEMTRDEWRASVVARGNSSRLLYSRSFTRFNR